VTRFRYLRAVNKYSVEPEVCTTICILIKKGDDVSQCSKVRHAICVARIIRRSQICWKFADNITDCHLVLDDLVISLLRRESAKILA
jgi:hypothetical protein